MTREETAHIAKLAGGAWRSEATPETRTAFHVALKDESLDDALEAVRRCLQEPNRRFAVTPPEIVGALRTLRTERAPTPPPLILPTAPMLEEYWMNGQRYVRASKDGARTIREWYKRAARDGAEAKAERKLKT